MKLKKTSQGILGTRSKIWLAITCIICNFAIFEYNKHFRQVVSSRNYPMLAYELFLLNRSSTGSNPKQVRPVKKVFFKNGRVDVDSKTPEEYGCDIKSKTQNILSMPLNTSRELYLPSKVTGANQARPYVELFGDMVRKKSATTFSISTSGKDKGNPKRKITFKATYDTQTKDRKWQLPAELLSLKIEKKYYFISGKSLFQLYVDSGIITQNGELEKDTFTAVCNKFFDFIEKRWTDDIDDRRMRFSLFLLPSEQPVEYHDLHPSEKSSAGIDSFGNQFTHFPDRPTQTAKFLSYDDPAFSLNFAQNEDFYKSLFIGNESYEKINIPAENVIEISGLNWIFADVSQPSFHFEKTGTGIYGQLWHNYNRLINKAGDPYSAKSQMKITCFKTTQAKVEILLDVNLTMQDMEKIFSKVNDKQIPSMALELLIQKNKQNLIWSDYLNAVRAVVSRRPVDYHWLIGVFSKTIRKHLFDWLDAPVGAREFFTRSEFCKKVLSAGEYSDGMNEAEDFAYRTGRIAGRYVRFKEESDEASSSLRDILTYSRYDREKLRFVIQRVGLGVNLSKAEKADLDRIAEFIKNEVSNAKEISDNDAFNDYSYFFYRGAFQELR
jgi:hypothetical protein